MAKTKRKTAAQLDREISQALNTKGRSTKPAPLACPTCDGGLRLEDEYGLVCAPCGIKVLGPITDASDIPDYKAAESDWEREIREQRR